MRMRSLLSFALLFSLLSIPAVAQGPTIDDFAGLLDGNAGKLYTTPNDQAGVLGALGARSDDGQTWTATTYRTDGTATEVRFRVILMDPTLLPALFPDPGDPIPCPHPNHIVYRNSICGYIHLAGIGFCQALSGGTSRQTTYDSYRSCKRQVGPTYCVDVRSVVGATKTYDSGNCTGVVTNTQSLFGWACK